MVDEKRFVVIFRAELGEIDEEYHATAARLHKRAMEEFGCVDFISVTEGDREVTLSYWLSRDDIATWKNDPEHLAAQELGKSKWYRSYSVEVATMERNPDSLSDP